jgi:hypothetical protein
LYERYLLHTKPTETITRTDTGNVTLAIDDEMMYAGYMLQSKKSCNDSSNDDTVTDNTAKIMKSILYEKDDNMCVIM